MLLYACLADGRLRLALVKEGHGERHAGRGVQVALHLVAPAFGRQRVRARADASRQVQVGHPSGLGYREVHVAALYGQLRGLHLRSVQQGLLIDRLQRWHRCQRLVVRRCGYGHVEVLVARQLQQLLQLQLVASQHALALHYAIFVRGTLGSELRQVGLRYLAYLEHRLAAVLVLRARLQAGLAHSDGLRLVEYLHV